MDARTSERVARNGHRLHPRAMVLEASKVVACVDHGTPERCPYGMGTSCPIGEVAQRVVKRRRRIADGVGLGIGIALSALAIWWVYF